MKYIHWQSGRYANFLDASIRRDNDESLYFKKLLSSNNVQVLDRIYADPHLLRHYLVESRLNFYTQVAKRVVSHCGKNRSTSACVDVGCGTGHLLNLMRKLGFAGRLVGLDLAPAAGDHVRNQEMEFCLGYLADQPWVNEFDLVLCTEVLEHCDYPADIVRDMIRVTKTGGMILITVPDGRRDTWEGHIHFWSPESFKLFIESFQLSATFDYFEDTNFCILHC